MIGWHQNYDWTKEDMERIIKNAKENGEESVNLDTEHSSSSGIRHMMDQLKEMGYDPVNKEDQETIYVNLKKRKEEENAD